MKLLFLIGNTAVGKMTVGQALCKITNFKLFHNHMTIEPVVELFGYPQQPTVNRLRDVIFEEFAKSEQYGLIFTYMWAFDEQADWDYIEYVKSIFTPYDTEFYYVELVAEQIERIARNKTENRLNHKASKRNLDFSHRLLMETDEHYRCESYESEIPFDNYIKIDNTYLSTDEVVGLIREKFSF